ncbi:MAG: hypothetical protein AAF466_09055 [Bacteroidota bacterium]
MQRKFLTYGFLFFLPVVLVYGLMEYLSDDLPSAFKTNRAYIDREQDSFTTLILGSSQMQGAVNPAEMENSLNLASGDQHHDTDFKLLQALRTKLPKLKTVVLEVSYSHFELPHNGPDFWKNALYLKYYDVNCYERNTYFKDRLLYLANPKVFSKKIKGHFVDKEQNEMYNAFGFNENNFQGQFKDLGHDEAAIAAMPRFKINQEPNTSIFEQNSALFLEMMDYLSEQELQVVICQLPMYKTYHARKHPDILRRRDSLVSEVIKKYPNVRLLDQESDTTNYVVHDFWNQSHLNPKGAKKFTRSLRELLSLNP